MEIVHQVSQLFLLFLPKPGHLCLMLLAHRFDGLLLFALRQVGLPGRFALPEASPDSPDDKDNEVNDKQDTRDRDRDQPGLGDEDGDDRREMMSGALPEAVRDLHDRGKPKLRREEPGDTASSEIAYNHKDNLKSPEIVPLRPSPDGAVSGIARPASGYMVRRRGR